LLYSLCQNPQLCEACIYFWVVVFAWKIEIPFT
jgi:hypothetical protein